MPDADNQAMADADSTAKRLQDALGAAWLRWRATDPVAHTKAALARLLSQRTGRRCTPQTVNGWFATGRMDKFWIGPIEEVLGTSLGFSRPSLSMNESSVAHSLSLDKFTVPPLRTMEELMSTQMLDASFRLALPDDAMAPEHPRDTEFIWSTSKAPAIQSLVLIKDQHGRMHIREYRQGREPGQWLAAATNRAFASFDSQLDGLQLLAVAAYRALP